MRRIASPLIFASRKLSLRGIFTLDAKSNVVDISSWEHPRELAGVEFFDGLLMESTVNAHCHLELSALRGKIAPGGGFVNFARTMGSLRRDTPDREAAIAAQDAAMWAEGIGAVGDICNGSSTFAAKENSRIVYRDFQEIFGLTTTLPEAGRSFFRPGKVPFSVLRSPFSVTPHSTYSLQSAAFADAVAAGEGPLSIHFMESPDEAALFEGSGALNDWYAERGLPPVDFAGYGSPAGRIIAQVPSDRDILLVHNTFITGLDIDRLAAHFGNRLTMVLCPRSNRHITGALPPVELLRRKGVRIAVGTDSLASNTSLTLLEELKMFPGVPLEERLRWATDNGCRALRIDRPLPGLTLVEGVDPATGTLSPRAAARRIA